MAAAASVVTLRPASLAPRGLHGHAARPRGLGLGIGEHRLNELELGDRLAELLALGRVVERVGDQPLGDPDADGADVEPAPVQHLHRGLEALALGAGPPMIASTGTRTFSKITSQVCAPCWPIFLSGLPSEIPGVPASTRKAQTPRASVLAGIGAGKDREEAGLLARW